jgi:uncharacterized protein (TIGR02246 family)
MLRRPHLFGGLLLGLLVIGCAAGPPAADTAADEQAIGAVSAREIASFNSGAVDETLAVFTADAVVMSPNEPMHSGADAIRTWLQNMASQFTVSGRYTDSKITVAGDWAIERYTAVLSLTPKAGGAPVEEPMKGIHIYQRQADGSWRIAQDVWNSDAPPPTASAPATPAPAAPATPTPR